MWETPDEMSTKARLWLITSLTLFLFLVATLVVRAVVQPAGGAAWMVLGGLAALGLTATGIVHRFLSLRWKDRIRREKIAAREDQISHAFTAARKRLAASGRAESPKIGALPLVLLLGPQGSTKTTAVVRSGLEPELLAGEVHQGDAVVPTESVNLWFAENTVLLEAGGRLLDQEERWEAVLDHAQPHRLAAALGRGTQASRVAVVCVGCDEFLKPGAAEAVPALARKLRERLVAGAQALGIQLPVYVLFTRADRLPYFEDYVRSLSEEEAGGALGSILTIDDPSRSGVYAEDQARRVDTAMDGILRNLALNRRRVIRRESDAEIQAGAYEFPRELGKVSGLMRRFLVDLCRPSQLNVSPFLRGFYFTGVRAIVVSDPGAAPAAPSPGLEDAPMGATAVFDPSKLQAGAAPSQPSSRSRRVPDWVFLEPVFRDVVLADRSARAVTRGGSRVDFLRRSLLTAATLAALFLAGATTVSFVRNRALAHRTVNAAQEVTSVGSASNSIPVLSELQTLERLRGPADTLWSWEREGPPWSYRWGLWVGDNMLSDAVAVYLRAFERVVGTHARSALLANLEATPAEPGGASEYEATYQALKAYLILTEYPERSTPEFLTPAVLARWNVAPFLEAEGNELLEAQIDFFAEIIVEEDRLALAEQIPVTRTRTFLEQFGDADRFYQSMVTEAGTRSDPVDFGTDFPAAQAVLRNEHLVPAAFTRPARRFVLDADVNEFFSSEDWVLGEAAVPPENRVALEDSLKERYEREYVEQWTSFLSSARVVPFSGPADAARKLSLLSASTSPLLEVLALASHHANVEDSTRVRNAFHSVHSVLPPGLEDSYIGEHNQEYLDALRSLRGAMDQVAAADAGSRPSAIGQANQAASQAETAVSGLEQGFGIGAEGAPVRSALQSLLLQPVRRAEQVLSVAPIGEMNERGRTFCRDYGQLLSGFPFQTGADRPASVEDVIQALKPGESALSSFYDDVLADILARQGSRYQARVGAEPTPTQAFVDFFNRATAVSEALFTESGEGPQVVLTIRPSIPDGYSAITVSVDGTTNTFTPTSQRAEPISWEARRGEYARITGELDGAPVPLVEAAGSPWAIFELFQQARWERLGTNRFRVHWTVPARGTTLSAEIQLTSPDPILDPSFLRSAAQCVSRIAG